MKKSVQITTIPLGKESIPKNSIVKCISEFSNVIKVGDIFIVDCYIDKQDDEYKSLEAQQLLVLSDDVIQDDDWYLNTENKLRRKNGIVNFPSKGGRKIIASYPQLEDNLPISKKTVQAWIHAGTPKEGSINFVDSKCKDDSECCYSEGYCEFMCGKDKGDVINLDAEGNLLLEFDMEIGQDVFSEGISQMDTQEQIINNRLQSKARAKNNPSVVTDEEIAKKSDIFAHDYHWDDSSYKGSKFGFFEGYKQALKDLNKIK